MIYEIIEITITYSIKSAKDEENLPLLKDFVTWLKL